MYNWRLGPSKSRAYLTGALQNFHSHIMVQPTTHQMNKDKKTTMALVTRRACAEKAEGEDNGLSTIQIKR